MGVIVYVVLHYENIKDTEQCIKSLENYVGENTYIVVVDNGSIKEKACNLEKEYKGKSHYIFLYSEKNLGFAKGNNIGYRYAKKELNADTIVLCNNDLVFEQDSFNTKLLNLSHTIGFDVAGPKIISLIDGLNQNPVPVLYNTVKDVRRRILKYQILLLFSKIDADLLIKKWFGNEKKRYDNKICSDYQLHGACLIFSNRYVKENDGIYDGTFMYEEESILKFLISKYNYKMVYLDELCVKHKEGASTESVFGRGKEKRQFYYLWNIKSCKLLLELMKGK